MADPRRRSYPPWRVRSPRRRKQGLMHGRGAEGARGVPSKKDSGARRAPGAPMPTTDDEIQEKYLERAIRELNQLTHRLQECSHCPRGNLMPVLGSGHPQADVMLL